MMSFCDAISGIDVGKEPSKQHKSSQFVSAGEQQRTATGWHTGLMTTLANEPYGISKENKQRE